MLPVCRFIFRFWPGSLADHTSCHFLLGVGAHGRQEQVGIFLTTVRAVPWIHLRQATYSTIATHPCLFFFFFSPQLTTEKHLHFTVFV